MSDMHRPLEETVEQTSSNLKGRVESQSDQTLGTKVRDIFMQVMTRGNWDAWLGFFEIIVRWLSDPLVMLLRKRIGERHFSWSILLSWYVLIGVVGFFASLVGPLVGMGYEYYIYSLFSKVYLVAGMVQYARITYRRYWGDPNDDIYSFSMGNSIFYDHFLSLCDRFKIRPLSESNFQKYVECGVVIFVGLIIWLVCGLGFGKFLIFSALALYLTMVQRENRFRHRLMDSTDSKIINNQMMKSIKGESVAPANNQGFPMADILVNEVKKAYGEGIVDEFTDELNRLKEKAQNLEDELPKSN